MTLETKRKVKANTIILNTTDSSDRFFWLVSKRVSSGQRERHATHEQDIHRGGRGGGLTSDTDLVPLERQLGVVQVGMALNLQMDPHGHFLGDVPSAGQADGERGEVVGDVALHWHVDVGWQESAQLALVLDGQGVADLQRGISWREYSEETLLRGWPLTGVSTRLCQENVKSCTCSGTGTTNDMAKWLTMPWRT